MTSGKDLTHATTVSERGWDVCLQCQFPYVIEDLVPICDPWTGQLRWYLCRWHHAHPTAINRVVSAA